MKQRFLGFRQRIVSAVGLGAMPLAIQGRPEPVAAVRVIHAALDAGMTWIDVADSYCKDETEVGYGEALVRRALSEWSGPSASILVTTKGGYVRTGGEWQLNGHPDHIRAACEASLKALGVSCFELYQLHGPDPAVYFPDTLGALADLRREGKIRHIGVCNVDVGHLQDASSVVTIVSVQNRCNLFERHCFANGVIDWCERSGAAFIAHSPVGGHNGHARVANHPVLNAIAERHGASSYQVALAWLLAASETILVIPGASRVSSAESSAKAAELQLSADDLAAIARAFPPASPVIKQLVGVRRKVRQMLRNNRRRIARR